MADKAADQENEQIDDKNTDKGTDKGQDQGGDDKGGDKPSETEARARRMGWRPKDEYTESGRDASKWVDADEFVRRGEESLPVLRERLRKQEKIIEAQDKKMEEGNKLLRELVTHQKAQTEAAVKKAIKELKAERREAAAAGEADKVEELSEEIGKAEDSLKQKEEKKGDDKPSIPQEVVDWAEENASWFKTDRTMNAYATAVYGDLIEDSSLTEKQRLAKVKAEVVKRFPEKFGNQRRNEPPAVESGQGGGGRKPTGKGWNDIPAEERALASRLIRQGAVKDEKAYAKMYWEQSAA